MHKIIFLLLFIFLAKLSYAQSIFVKELSSNYYEGSEETVPVFSSIEKVIFCKKDQKWAIGDRECPLNNRKSYGDTIGVSNLTEGTLSSVVLLGERMKIYQKPRIYTPSKTELYDVLYALKPVFEKHLEKESCQKHWNGMHPKMRAFLMNFKIQEVEAMENECFLTAEGHKIIKVQFPAHGLRWMSFYPFNDICWREDNAPDIFFVTAVIKKDGSVQILSDEITFLTEGDFDHDGENELMFFYSTFNNYAYVLYSNNFQDETKFEWSLH